MLRRTDKERCSGGNGDGASNDDDDDDDDVSVDQYPCDYDDIILILACMYIGVV